MTVVRVWWGWLRVAVVDTLWPTEHGKSAQSITNICPWKSELTFQCTRSFFLKRIKTHLLIYHSQRTQSSSWQVSLTCFTHLHTKKKKPVCKLRLWMSHEVLVSSHNHILDPLDLSLQSGEERKKTKKTKTKHKHCQLMPEVTFFKKKKNQLQ